MGIKELFMNKLEEYYEALSDGNPSKERLATLLSTPENLNECLSAIKSEQEKIETGISDCDHKIKSWQMAKKNWKSRQEVLMEALQDAMTSLNIKNATDGNVKVTMTTKRTIDIVNPDEILKQYMDAVDTLRASLPPYVKISVDIDKTQLNAFLKQDDSLLLTMPENIHYKDSRSIRIS